MKRQLLPTNEYFPASLRRKKTSRWCRGRIGIEHTAFYDQKIFDVPRQNLIWWKVRCGDCQRVLRRKITDLAGVEKPERACDRCGRKNPRLNTFTGICIARTGCSLN